MYATKNFRTKKALKEAVKTWQNRESLACCGPATLGAVLAHRMPSPPPVECHQPGPYGPTVRDGDHTCEGPHYPEAHRWYARVQVSAGRIIKVLS